MFMLSRCSVMTVTVELWHPLNLYEFVKREEGNYRSESTGCSYSFCGNRGCHAAACPSVPKSSCPPAQAPCLDISWCREEGFEELVSFLSSRFITQVPEQWLGIMPISSFLFFLLFSHCKKITAHPKSCAGPIVSWDRTVGFLVTSVLMLNAV